MNNALLGFVLFLGVLAFPLAAIGLPFFNLWYGRNRDKVNVQVGTVRARVDEMREKRDAAYAEDELAENDDSAADEDAE